MAKKHNQAAKSQPNGTSTLAVDSQSAPSAVTRIILGLFSLGLVALVIWSMAYRVSNPGLTAGGKAHGAAAQAPGSGGAPAGMTPEGMSQEAMGDIAALMGKLRENPEDTEAAWQIAGRFMMSGAFDRALFFLEKVEKARPGDVDVKNSLAVALHGLGRTDEARTRFETMVKDHPDDYRALFNLGIISKEQGDAAASKAWLEKASKVKNLPDDLRHQIEDELKAAGK